MISATCECKAVRFASSAEPLFHGYCHCADCRAATGRPFSEIAFFDISDCSLQGSLRSRDFMLSDGVVTHRDACSMCSTVIFDRSDRFQLVGVMAQLLRGMSSSPTFHMWVSSRVDGVAINDGLPQFASRPEPAGVVRIVPRG